MIQSYPTVTLLGSSQSAKQLQNKIETKYCIYRPITHTLFRQLSEIQTYGLHKFFCKWLYVKHWAKAMVIIKHWQCITTSMQDQILSSGLIYTSRKHNALGFVLVHSVSCSETSKEPTLSFWTRTVRSVGALAQLPVKWGFVAFAEKQ